jgi:hypothetical protein
MTPEEKYALGKARRIDPLPIHTITPRVSLKNASVSDILTLTGTGGAVASITYDVGARAWTLHQRFVYYDAERNRTIIIPAGFRFDLASIPRQLWWAIGPHELSVEAALVHDWLYAHGGAPPDGPVYTRSEADALFSDMMALYGVARLRRMAAYRAVRLFGARHWKAT